MTRVLAVIAGSVNVVCMFLAHLTDDWPVFITGWFGATVSALGYMYFTDDARQQGETRMGYQALAMRLRWDIKEEGLLAGARLPSVTELARRHETTRTTVMRALRILADEGLVDIVQGRGSYVLDNGFVGLRADRPKDLIERHLIDVKPGERIPSMQDLIEQHDVSPATIRRVQARLAERGLIRRTRTGAYVRA
jgi:GntR family transcriptional regulator